MFTSHRFAGVPCGCFSKLLLLWPPVDLAMQRVSICHLALAQQSDSMMPWLELLIAQMFARGRGNAGCAVHRTASVDAVRSSEHIAALCAVKPLFVPSLLLLGVYPVPYAAHEVY
jgi:hypothetical protein